MATLEREIADYLEDQGIGTVGTDIFGGKQSDMPHNQIVVKDTGGVEPHAHVPTRNRSVQILVRNEDKETCDSVATSIYSLLHNRFETKVVTAGTNYSMRSHALQEPTPIGQDENGRYENSCNYLFLTR